ncbi:MAG: DUF3093 domain-containing protein, partial [Salinibacterium sp.]|nr:DUF3093 domain-containing protein [Salinibacterium sp.]
ERGRPPVRLGGSATPFRGREATLERGRNLDARAWLLIRGWVGPVVKVENTDPDDPTPYWLVSSRKPEELASALSRRASQV